LLLNESPRNAFSFEVYSRISFPVRVKPKEAPRDPQKSTASNALNMGNLFVEHDWVRPLKTKGTDFSKKIYVRIDHKTFILTDPGTTADEARSLLEVRMQSKIIK
jgi:hypothetical protein